MGGGSQDGSWETDIPGLAAVMSPTNGRWVMVVPCVLLARLGEEPQEESGSLPDSLHRHGEWPSGDAAVEELQNLSEQQSRSALSLTHVVSYSNHLLCQQEPCPSILALSVTCHLCPAGQALGPRRANRLSS